MRAATAAKEKNEKKKLLFPWRAFEFLPPEETRELELLTKIELRALRPDEVTKKQKPYQDAPRA